MARSYFRRWWILQCLGISDIKTEDKATFGEHSEVLELDTATGDATNNYVFDFESYKKGTLTITEERNAFRRRQHQ